MLGSNGAGKSTLFKIMLSEIFPSNGSVLIKGLKLSYSNLQIIRKFIGYCPQINSFYDFLTVYEHLYLILEIKNIKKDIRESLISSKLLELGLSQYSD